MPDLSRTRTVLATVVAVALSAVWPGTASASPQVKGSGSTFAQIAIDQWARDAAARLSVNIIYSGTGSTSGRSQFVNETVDWASSDVNFPRSELPVARKFTYLPLVAGGTSFPYKVIDAGGNRIDDLHLSPRTLARIFLGGPMFWNDPVIVAENPHLANRLPNLEVKPVLRAEGSGTTSVLTGFFSRVAPDVWQSFLRAYPEAEVEQTDVVSSFIQKFPDRAYGEKVNGSFGVATRIAENTPAANGKIGYAEYGYAKEARIPVARVRNASGAWTLPEAKAVAIALTRATRNPDGTQNLSEVFGNPDPQTYPVSSYNYAIVPTAATEKFDQAKGEALSKYLAFSVTEGQAKAERLGYSPLPCNLIEQSLAAIRTIPGAPADVPTSCGAYGDYYKGLDPAPPYVPPTAPPASGGPAAAAGAGATGPSATGNAGAAATGTAAPGGAAEGTGAAVASGAAPRVASSGRATGPSRRSNAAGAGRPAEGAAVDAAPAGEGAGPALGIAADPVVAAELRTERIADLARSLRRSRPRAPSALPLAVAGATAVAVVYVPPLAALALGRRRD